MIYDSSKTVLEYFYEHEKEHGDKYFLIQNYGDNSISFTYSEVGEQIRRISSFIKKSGLKKGEKIGIASKNCAEFVVADLAIMHAGCISVLFDENSDLIESIKASECKMLFVGKLDNVPVSVNTSLPDIILVNFPFYNPNLRITSWIEVLRENEPDDSTISLDKSDVFTMIYNEKLQNPLLVSHEKVGLFFKFCISFFIVDELEDYRFFSYRSLNNINERIFLEHFCIIMGGTIYFNHNHNSINRDIFEAKPSHFYGTPEIWHSFKNGIIKSLSQKQLNLLLAIPILDRFSRKRLNKGLGLEDVKLVLNFERPIPIALNRWFWKIGIKIKENFGVPECLGAISISSENKSNDLEVGIPYPEMKVKLKKGTQEILCQAPWVLNEFSEKENYFNTGIKGNMDKNGVLYLNTSKNTNFGD